MFELLGSAVVLNAGVVWRCAGGLEVGGQEGGGGLAGARGHRLQQLQHTLGVLLVAQQRQILPLQIGDIALRRHIVEVRELKPIVYLATLRSYGSCLYIYCFGSRMMEVKV